MIFRKIKKIMNIQVLVKSLNKYFKLKIILHKIVDNNYIVILINNKIRRQAITLYRHKIIKL